MMTADNEELRAAIRTQVEKMPEQLVNILVDGIEAAVVTSSAELPSKLSRLRGMVRQYQIEDTDGTFSDSERGIKPSEILAVIGETDEA